MYFDTFQGDYDPVKTRVLHFKMNPTTVAKQQRQQETEALQEEVTRLRELVRSLQEGGAALHSQDDSSMHTPNLSLSLPPSREVLGKITNQICIYYLSGTFKHSFIFMFIEPNTNTYF